MCASWILYLREALTSQLSPRYYGFLDDDDCRLIPLEVEAERDAVAAAVRAWKEKKGKGVEEREEEEDEEDIYAVPPDMSDADRLEEAMAAGKERRFTSHVVIPTQKDIEEALLRRKKQELMQMYALDEFDDAKKDVSKKEEAK